MEESMEKSLYKISIIRRKNTQLHQDVVKMY